MEQLAQLKGKNLKFLPRQPVASIQNPTLSPSRSVAGNRSPSHIVSIIPKEARRKLRSSSFSAREPSSPKVSCMADVQFMKKKKRKRKARKKWRRCCLGFSREAVIMMSVRPVKGKVGKLKLELEEKGKAPRVTQNAPSLATTKKFVSGRGTLSIFNSITFWINRRVIIY